MNKKLISRALDSAVVPGFSRIGCEVRSRLNSWEKIEDMNLTGRVIVITGPTSGLGKETARMLTSAGAQIVLVGRNQVKCEQTAAELQRIPGAVSPVVVVADMGNLESVATASRTIRERFPRVDVVIHNAGALLQKRELSPQGTDLTVACHVLGPHLMTSVLRDSLRAGHGRVVTVSSGGMYAAPLPHLHEDESLEMSAESYNGSRQYAIAKRAQVTLNEIWATKESEVEFVAMHPGWADTPGVQDSIPAFRLITRPILRTAQQGADTIAWLAAVRPLPGVSGTFWSDREVRPIHKIGSTTKSDNADAREALWSFCNDAVSHYL